MQPYFRAVSFRRVHEFIPSCFRTLVCAVLASVLSSPVFAENTIVRMEVAYGDVNGNIDVELYDDEVPITVANFLRYAGLGYYGSNALFNGNFHNGFFHRSVSGFTIRAGGYGYYYNPFEVPDAAIYEQVPQFSPIPNEFSPSRRNIRGTITMGKQSTDPDSATSEWIINLADNGTNFLNFDSTNGGYAVFGQVVAGMDHAMAIGGLPNSPDPVFPTKITSNGASGIVPGTFTNLPRINYDQNAGVPVQPENLARLIRIPNVKSTGTIWGTFAIFTADVDMAFNSVETFNAAATESLLSTFTPPSGTSAYHVSGILGFTITGTMGQTGRVVTLRHGSSTTPNRYYAYGPTPDNPVDHWYDFSYDGETGAEMVGGKIRLHFVDGKRGDGDLNETNNSITHYGAPVLITENDAEKLSGCTIATSPSPPTSHGDWIMVAMFMAFLGLVRKRARR